MIPQKQKFRHDPKNGILGDCERTAVACILDLHRDDVPHFWQTPDDTGEDFERRMRDFLYSKNLRAVSFFFYGTSESGEDMLHVVFDYMKQNNPGIYYLLSGQSSNKVDHTVVGLEDKIAWDPSLDNSGIVGPMVRDGLYCVRIFVPDWHATPPDHNLPKQLFGV